MIELLVAMGLGVLLMLGVLTVFDSSREGTRVQEAMASVQDTGRIAMDFISRDFRNADFAGCVNDKSRVQNLVTGGGDFTGFFNGGGITGTTNAKDATIGGRKVLDGTSTVRIVGAQPACDGISSLDSSAGDEDDPLTFRTSCAIPQGTILLVSNCQFGDIFVKTNADTATTIEHTTSPVGSLSNSSAIFQTTYREEAQVLRPFVREYFLATNTRNGTSLYRRDNGDVQELVPNVESFEIMYGSDTSDPADGAADVFSASPTDMSQVVSARVSLTVRSNSELNGQPLTRTYSGTSSIRNRLVLSEASN
ncbi:PilW family protein [Halioxenophilus aromaticivorans]|uniref:PilW family protein n=2 Tax=Halioxenophilus aromaticivorans TaxID=1306992 RepID=A0AAV3TXW1_9ALTE